MEHLNKDNNADRALALFAPRWILDPFPSLGFGYGDLTLIDPVGGRRSRRSLGSRKNWVRSGKMVAAEFSK